MAISAARSRIVIEVVFAAMNTTAATARNPTATMIRVIPDSELMKLW